MLGSSASNAILQLRFAHLAGAVRATKEVRIRLQAVADDLDAAVSTNRSQDMNGALKAIKNVLRATHDDFERLIVLIATVFTTCH